MVLTLGQGEAVQDPTVVIGTFPLKNSSVTPYSIVKLSEASLVTNSNTY